MLIKAVFFDLYNTLITYQPSRQEIHLRALARQGIKLDRHKILQGLQAGDEYYYRQNCQSAVKNRPAQEQQKVWHGYVATLLETAGLDAEPGLVKGILKSLAETRFEMALFEDVQPVMDSLLNGPLKLGIISNIDRDITSMCRELGLDRIQVVVTSLEAGASKPSAGIFKQAARKAGCSTRQSVYVGDQYEVDVLGARNAGMTGILLDREDLYASSNLDGYRITSMQELPALLDRIDA